LGNQTKSAKKLSSRFAKKKSTVKKPAFSTARALSPHYESDATPPQVKSRFSSRRNNDIGRNLEGSLRTAEKSVMSALAVGGDTVGDEKESDAKLIEKDDEDSPAMRSILSRFAKTPKKSPSSAKGVEYTVSFEPGPIGLKLEPVLRNGTKEFGCRVMNFVDNGKTSLSPSQALKSGNIYVGDVLTAVNGKNVTSKSYKDIVSMLTATSGKRNITFRVPRSPATVMPKTPARSVTTAKKEQMNASAVASSVTTRAQNKADPAAAGSTPFFSPSSVKKMARSSVSPLFSKESLEIAFGSFEYCPKEYCT